MMDKEAGKRDRWVSGTCANCGKVLWEGLFMLDDAYAVYRGECPYCQAINLLGGPGRGYGSQGMNLVLPTDCEMHMNNWPEKCPVRICSDPKCSCRAGNK